MRTNRFRMVACATMGLVLTAGAWGPGHNVIGHCLLEKMPAQWRARFRAEWRADYEHATHLPDRGSLKLLPAADVAWFRANCGLKDDSFVFHKLVPLYGCVDRLVHALRTGDDRAVFIYLATLSHAIGDPAACNHDPIIHLPTYIWSKGALDVMPRGPRAFPVDFAFAEYDAETRARLAERLRDLPLWDVPADLTPERLYAEMARWEVLSSELCGRVSQAILANGAKWLETGDATAKLAASDALTELGFWSVQRTLYVFAAARMWAEKGEITRPAAELGKIAATQATNEVSILARTVADDMFARPYLAEPGRPSRVRVLYDTTAHMASSVLSPLNRPLGCQIVGSLKRIRPDLNASLMNVRDFAAEGLDPREAPVLVMFRGVIGYRRFDVKGFNARMKAYLAAGGKVVWISGPAPADVFGGAVAKAQSNGGRRDGYCKPAYPVSSLDVLLKSSFAWTGPGERKVWGWQRRPTGTAGWFWEGSPFVFDVAKLPEGVASVAEIRSPEGVFAMAVRTPCAVYLPVCALFPYCLTGERPQLVPFRLALDSAGDTVMLNVLKGFGI